MSLPPTPAPAVNWPKDIPIVGGGCVMAATYYTTDQLRAYGQQCADAERERCAKLCDAAASELLQVAETCGGDDGNEVAQAQQARELAAAIRSAK